MAIEVYSTDTDSGQISIVRRNRDGFENVGSIRVGNAPRGSVKFTADGRGFVSNTSGTTISEIDGLTHCEVGKIEVGAGPRGLHLAAGDRYLLVSNSGSNTMSIVDVRTRREVRQVAVGRDPRHMVVVGRSAYVCLWGEGSLAKVDIAPLDVGDVDAVTVVGRIPLGAETFPYSVNVDVSRMKALVACNGLQSIPVIGLSSDRLVADIPIRSGGARAVAFSKDAKYAFVTLERESLVAVVDLDSDTVTRYIPVGPGPRGVAVDPTGTIYAAAFSRPIVTMFELEDYGAHSVTIIDPTGANLSREGDDVTVTSVRVGFGPCSVSVLDTDAVRLARAMAATETVDA